MSELLACVGRVSRCIREWKMMDAARRRDQDKDDEWIMADYTLDMAVHASVVTLTLCKTRAGEILDLVLNGPYESELQSWCNQIKIKSKSLI